MYIFIHANLGIYCKYQEQVFAAIPRERIEDMLTEFENSKDLLPFAVLNPFLDILRTSGHLRPKIAPLFSRIADEIDRNKVFIFSPLQITYFLHKKNSSNSFLKVSPRALTQLWIHAPNRITAEEKEIVLSWLVPGQVDNVADIIYQWTNIEKVSSCSNRMKISTYATFLSNPHRERVWIHFPWRSFT